MDALLGNATLVLTAFGVLVGPAAAVSLVLHWAERRMTGGLMHLSGRHAVLVTGWLGVPIHELSHAAMCLLFRHRIHRIVLFHPDPKTGTLGFVEHSWDRRNPWAVVGSFFVGIAPLLGGAAVMLGLGRLLVPGVFTVPDLPLPAGPGDTAGWTALGSGLAASVGTSLRALFSPENLGSGRLWLFLYLALCVGSHVSPSPQDLRGSVWGALAFFAFAVIAGGVAAAAGGEAAMMRAAVGGGVAVGVPLALVAAVNVPLALALGAVGRIRG